MNLIYIGIKPFHRNQLYFRIYADLEADNEIDNLVLEMKQLTIINKIQFLMVFFYIVSELNDVLQSGYCEFPLGYDNVDWFVDEIIKLENKVTFYFKNTKKIL